MCAVNLEVPISQGREGSAKTKLKVCQPDHWQLMMQYLGTVMYLLSFLLASLLITRSLGISTVLMRNGSHASVRGVGMVHPKFTSRKIVQYVSSTNNNLVSGCILCKDGFKFVLSPIMQCRSMDLLLEKAMSAEVRSTFPHQIFVTRP